MKNNISKNGMLEQIQSDLISYMKLEKGWNFGDGEPITQESAAISFAISKSLLESDQKYNFIEVFPEIDGTIEIRICFNQNDILSLDVKSEDNIEIDLFLENQPIQNLGKVSLSKIKKRIDKILGLTGRSIWTSRDYYTSQTIHSMIINLEKNPSSLENSVMENLSKHYPSYEYNVQLLNIKQSVDSSTVIRKHSKKQQVFRSYTGKSLTQYSQYRVAV